MHTSALQIGGAFLKTWARPGGVIADVGAYDLNGTLRSVSPPEMKYIGIDLEAGPGVDLVAELNQPLPLENDSIDLVVCSSCFEHDGAFWLTFLELIRVVKTGGLIYLNVPSNGHVHNHPNDCWRFYPDAGLSLERWAERQGHQVTLLESFVAERKEEFWNDFVAVFMKGKLQGSNGPLPFLSERFPATNIRRFGVEGVIKAREKTEDQLLLDRQSMEIRRLRAELARISALQPVP